MGNPKSFRLEAAGWGFWFVTTLLLTGPCVYGAFQVIQEHYSYEVPIGFGLIGATVLAAIVTLIANTLIQRGNERRKATERKQIKQSKNKK